MDLCHAISRSDVNVIWDSLVVNMEVLKIQTSHSQKPAASWYVILGFK